MVDYEWSTQLIYLQLIADQLSNCKICIFLKKKFIYFNQNLCFFNNNKILFNFNMAQAYWSLLFEKEKKEAKASSGDEYWVGRTNGARDS